MTARIKHNAFNYSLRSAILFLFAFISLNNFAQNDSLYGVWQNKNYSDSIRIEAGLKWCQKVNDSTQFDKAIKFCADVMELKKNEPSSQHYLSAHRLKIIKSAEKNGTDELVEFEILYNKAKQEKVIEALAIWTYSIAYHHQIRDNYEACISYWIECLTYYEKIGDNLKLARIHQNLSFVFQQIKEYDKSFDEGNKALNIYTELNDTTGMIDMMTRMGGMASNINELEYSQSLIDSAEVLAKIYGDPYLINFTRATRGQLMVASGEYAKARELYLESLDYLEKIGESARGLSFYNSLLCVVYLKEKDYKNGLKYGKAGLDIALKNNLVKEEFDNLIPLELIYVELHDFKNAFETRKRIIELENKMRSASGVVDITNQFSSFEAEKEEYTDSLEQVNKQQILELEHKNSLASQRNQKYFGGVGIILMLIVAFLLFAENRRKKKFNAELSHKKITIEIQKKEIIDSILYAKRIQGAILPSSAEFNRNLPSSFIHYKPKDIVAGDFYWLEKKDDKVLFAAADCTGHGVPGAMVSVVCNNALNRSVREFNLTDPGAILDSTRNIVIEEFEKSEEEVRDGMDISLCAFDSQTNSLKWSGANNPLWIIRKGSTEIEEIKPNKQPIGKYAEPKPFTTNQIQLNSGDTFYIFTDGIQDQFGGEKGKKFKASNLKKLLIDIQKESLQSQEKLIDSAFETWRGNLEQIDDVCLIGVRV